MKDIKETHTKYFSSPEGKGLLISWLTWIEKIWFNNSKKKGQIRARVQRREEGKGSRVRN